MKNWLKSLIIGSFISLSIGTGYAANGDAGAPLTTLPLLPAPYPGVQWLATNATYTIDQAGALYLPYLPSVNTNVSLLAQYIYYFYQLSRGSITDGDSLSIDKISAQGSSALPALQSTVQANTMTATGTALQNFLPNSPSTPSSTTQQQNALLALPGSDFQESCSGPNCQNEDLNDAFNADTLLGTDGYLSDKTAIVQGLISFMTNNIIQLDPASSTPINVSKVDNYTKSYILQARAMAAAQSLALSNFNYLAQERLIQPGMGKTAGVTELPTNANDLSKTNVVNDASLLQVEEFLVNQRFANSTWYTQVDTASSIATQRETLLMLAEIQHQLLVANLQRDRMIALMAGMLTQMTQFSKTNLVVLQQKIGSVPSTAKNN